MGAAIALRYGVGETQHRFVEAVVPLHGEFHGYAIAIGRGRDRRFDGLVLGPVEIADEGLDAALVMEIDHFRFGMAGIRQLDSHAGIQE